MRQAPAFTLPLPMLGKDLEVFPRTGHDAVNMNGLVSPKLSSRLASVLFAFRNEGDECA